MKPGKLQMSKQNAQIYVGMYTTVQIFRSTLEHYIDYITETFLLDSCSDRSK